MSVSEIKDLFNRAGVEVSYSSPVLFDDCSGSITVFTHPRGFRVLMSYTVHGEKPWLVLDLHNDREFCYGTFEGALNRVFRVFRSHLVAA